MSDVPQVYDMLQLPNNRLHAIGHHLFDTAFQKLPVCSIGEEKCVFVSYALAGHDRLRAGCLHVVCTLHYLTEVMGEGFVLDGRDEVRSVFEPFVGCLMSYGRSVDRMSYCCCATIFLFFCSSVSRKAAELLDVFISLLSKSTLLFEGLLVCKYCLCVCVVAPLDCLSE